MPKSAVDVISLAFEHTKEQLTGPFRWGQWWRLAVLGLATGEMSTGGGCSWRGMRNAPRPNAGQGPFDWGKIWHSIDPAILVTLILIALGGALIVWVVWIYFASISRFVLFESVLRKHCDSIKAGWQRWEDTGMNFFWWLLGFAIVKIVVAAILFVPLLLPVLAVLRSHRHPGPDLILAFLPMIGVFVVFSLVMGLIAVLAKDFVVPLMAIDGIGVIDGWKRLLGMMAEEKGSYAGYILMKIVLNIAAWIVFTILSLVAAMFVMIPSAIVLVIVIIVAKGAGLGVNAFTVTAIIVGAGILIGVVLCVISLVSVPVAVFFPAYAMYFFAERFPALYARLYPPASPPVQAAPIVPPFTPPPEPIG